MTLLTIVMIASFMVCGVKNNSINDVTENLRWNICTEVFIS